MWRALDGGFERVELHPWGAVVTDSRFPLIWDVNYARVETDDAALSLGDVEAALDPALERSGAVHRHVVVFHPEALTGIVVAASSRGARLTWDDVMLLENAAMEPAPSVAVEEVAEVDGPFLDAVRRSLRAFEVEDPAVAGELVRIESEVLLPAGKRWFRVGAPGAEAALGSLVPLGDVGLVDHVVTFPFARRRGYADAIVRRIAAEARSAGVRDLVLLADPNGDAGRLYERIGFRTVATVASSLERR
jgi:GNAT superfamily N-acetyltransferase